MKILPMTYFSFFLDPVSMTSISSPGANGSSYDVFLSFRGEDTRYSFTDHLYKTLKQSGIDAFRDNDDINRGEELKPEIQRAIKESRASIVVLSENYATSSWCLDELMLILQQKREHNHFILPVFYHVDPSDVRKQNKTFAIEVKASSKWTDHNVNLWKKALKEVADLAGMVLSGSETDFIANVVDAIDCKLDMKLVSTPAHLIGMDTRAIGIDSWLKNEQSGPNVLAICGMGGIGKTTLAQFIYNSNKQDFESSSYLEEIGKHSKQPFGLLGLQKQLLTDILGGRNARISNVSEGTRKVEEALQVKRVLIVLDDIDGHEELGALLGTKAFHTKSKIIITTRLLDINAWFGSISWRCQVEKLELLNDHESLELLSCHAFGSKIPMEGFKELAVELTKYCGGNPLALKVLGSSLFVDAEDPRKQSNIIEIWESTLNSLYPLKGELDCKIQGILQKSFDSLPRASNKELFLHIAFFFVGEYEDYVVKILEHDWHAKSGIMTLINKCLLTVSPSNKLIMHQLLQEMARNIVLQESKDPAKRSRVSQNYESYRLLGKGKGSDSIEGLVLDMRKLEEEMRSDPLTLKTGSLAKMDKLKLLQLKFVVLSGSYKINFPELRWLCWHGCPLETIPSGLLMSSLVAIDMSYGNLKRFEPPKVLNSLKILNLKECYELVSIHNLSRLPNLESLILWNCSNLTHVCESIGGLKSLALLDFTGCKYLMKTLKSYLNHAQQFPGVCTDAGIQQSPFLLPDSLKLLFLNNCNLVKNNDVPVVSSDQSLFYMNLGNNLFEVLPNSLNLKTLRVLELTFCPNLKCLLCLPSTLEELYTNWCFSLEKITFESTRFRLREFVYRGCNKISEIQGLFKLVPIAKHDEADLGHMKWIKAYQDYWVDLVGDEITKERYLPIQVLYEYGIMSTYLPGIRDENMPIPDYMSSIPFLSFRVPSTEKHMIRGLNVTCLYSLSGEDEDMWVLFIKISNITKGLNWMYNPMVYCQPRFYEDAVWLSYWPIGNILDTGDEINVSIVGNGLMVSECSASFVYIDDDELELENCKSYTKGEEVIGGDLSDFELTTGAYYLCRRDYFKITTPDWLKVLLGDTIPSTELRGWRKSRQTQHLKASFMELKTFRPYAIPRLNTI
ncbi:disease resistance protein RUN1 isoform X2 [Lactuca sativa]|uniref:disease resistance protein RUN1 isoform X2 n=1 Tax=Lactuca sativa TaxID=4236 RepID=UPI001C68A327|nr:disease resistance protein RUN1 isoform X2 [Lactuca sativa]